MWVRVFTMVVAFSIVCASVACSESKRGNTGIAGVIMVTPIRPGPAKKGSEFPNVAPLPNATVSRYEQRRSSNYFHDRHGGSFPSLAQAGHYSVVLAENRFPKPCGPPELDVEPDKITEVEWRWDSGMR